MLPFSWLLATSFPQELSGGRRGRGRISFFFFLVLTVGDFLNQNWTPGLRAPTFAEEGGQPSAAVTLPGSPRRLRAKHFRPHRDPRAGQARGRVRSGDDPLRKERVSGAERGLLARMHPGIECKFHRSAGRGGFRPRVSLVTTAASGTRSPGNRKDSWVPGLDTVF